MERILNKIGRIREYVKLINSIRDDCTARFMSDPLSKLEDVEEFLRQIEGSLGIDKA